MIEERFELAKDRINRIIAEKEAETIPEQKYAGYFAFLAQWCQELISAYEDILQGAWESRSILEHAEQNRLLYQDIQREAYEKSYANPEMACRLFGLKMGQQLSFLYVELRSQIESAFEGDLSTLLIHLELFLEIYCCFLSAYEEENSAPTEATIHEILYSFVADNSEEMMEKRIRSQVNSDCDFATRIILASNAHNLDYLYRYGEFITDTQLKTAEFLAALPIDTIHTMADTFTEGYRIGFEKAGIDLNKKKTVNIRYCIGFERVIQCAIENFQKMGLKPTIYRASTQIWAKRGLLKIGYYGSIANRQMEYDHKEDQALFTDSRYINRKKENLKAAYEEVKELANVHAGPACMEIFGEEQFEPISKPEALKLTKRQQKLEVDYSAYSTNLVNHYIPGDERSFTIIAFPVPDIGPDFTKIFAETIRINTLDYHLYEHMQQKIINELDKCTDVVITGKGKNVTHMSVHLHDINDPEKESVFENCVADVNIPVGEVFTSPVLQKTEGTLFVSKVYLEGLEYRNLKLTFQEGMVTDYECENFATASENRNYIKENFLFHHDTLPLGEFAIGTNTTAYAVASKYHIFDKMPILIAEKMGPHFAVGDTCYSHCETVKVFNPDGKEVIAKENAISSLRDSDSAKAYFGCHTDITIPYDELDEIIGVHADGSKTVIIHDGKFALPGLEALNNPLYDA